MATDLRRDRDEVEDEGNRDDEDDDLDEGSAL